MSGKLTERLAEKAYREAFVEANIRTGIAHQIRAMREANGWTQAELARRVGTSQNAISRLEDPDYGRLSTATLLKLASAFDVALTLRFVSFSRFVEEWASFSPDALRVDPFQDDAEARLLAGEVVHCLDNVTHFPVRVSVQDVESEEPPAEWDEEGLAIAIG